MKVTKYIGFDSTEHHRVTGGGTYAVGKFKICPAKGLPQYKDRYDVSYPLREWGLDREACGRIILGAGLPLPPKSACFFCPAMKKAEIAQLEHTDPNLHALAIEMELVYRGGHHFRGDSFWTVRAKHKLTKESEETALEAPNKQAAIAAVRQQLSDTDRPSQYVYKASAAVPGLGRNFAWHRLSLPITRGA